MGWDKSNLNHEEHEVSRGRELEQFNNEEQPVSIIEAVVLTDYRAIPDMVVHEKTGFLVPYGQPETIAQVIAETTATNP